MDASGFPNDDHGHSNDPKQCSVRGCAQVLPDGTNNKMCDVCRSRHRIYASTKRARRKLEKAAVANAAAARSGGDTFMLIHESDHTGSQGSSTVSSWLSPGAQSLQQDLSPLSSQHSPSTPTASWNQAIDPRLFSSSNGIITTAFPAQTTSTSSELANALTLPTPRVKAQPETLQQPPHQTTDGVEESSKPSDKQSEAPKEGMENSSEGSTRFCSVKGCKAVIPESYEFKMCPPCRTRYRTYGNTKRAKWKMEREAFDREMASLRAIEDEKRKSNGLGPLANSPEELRAWELSIIDEQIELPTAVQTPPPAVQPPETDDPSVNFARLITSAATFPTDLQSPMVIAGVYPATIDTAHSISPYSHLHNTIVGAPAAPLPARMCTVSHCHKILPGYYRYKRCEQHRLQNRHHSQLKRVREKVVKSVGPEDGATPLEIDENGRNCTERAKKLKLLQQSRTTRKERKPRRDKEAKVKDGVSEPPEPMTEGSSPVSEHGPDDADAQGSPKPTAEETLEDKEQKPKGRPKVYSCTKEGCYNLLVPAQRWRTCDECRVIERKRQVQVRADQKAAECVYWKSISERMSAERKASVVADGGGPGSINVQAHVQGADHASGMDVDPDADADADGDSEFGGEEFMYPLEGASIALGVNAAQMPPPPPPPTTSTAMLYGPTTSSGNGFSKFFVQLPPAPPPVRKATSEELLKLSDTLTARVYRPKTTPSAIGRILAHNPHVSVDDFSDILEVDQSKSPASATPANDTNATQISNLASTESSDKSLPTATVPTSAPFVYEAPAKRSEKVAADAPTASSSKSKRKHKSSPQSVQNASAGPSTMSVPPIPGPANPYPIPYGYPPSYPYYPYYMPPYAYPPPSVGSDPTKQPYLPPTMISSTAPPPPAGYYPYAYPPAPYGYTHTYPYLPPRYTTSSYGQTPGQQPYPGPISSSAPGYSYYSPPLPPPVPVPAPVSAPAPAPTSAPPKPKPKPKEAEEPKAATTFSFHHYKLGQSGGPQEPRKRLKVDPNYLEKFKAHTSVLKMSLMPYADRSTGSSTSSTVPTASGENTALSESTQLDASRPDSASLQSVQQNIPAPTMEPGAEASTSVVPATRPCATKTCSRSIPAETHGTICEKCKLRFKKHQAKAKVKYKLEPRKFLKVKPSAEGSTQSGVS